MLQLLLALPSSPLFVAPSIELLAPFLGIEACERYLGNIWATKLHVEVVREFERKLVPNVYGLSCTLASCTLPRPLFPGAKSVNPILHEHCKSTAPCWPNRVSVLARTGAVSTSGVRVVFAHATCVLAESSDTKRQSDSHIKQVPSITSSIIGF